jgi:opacity protein-like surface antigen
VNDVLHLLQEIIMKKICLLFICILIVGSISSAQKSKDIVVSLHGGSAFPSTPMSFSQYWKMSYGGGGGVEIPVSSSMTIGANVDYYQFVMDEEGIRNSFATTHMRDIWAFNDVSIKPVASNSSVMSIALNMRIESPDLNGALRPYLIVGGGLLKYSFAEIDLPVKSTIVMNGESVSMTSQQKIIGGDKTDPFVQLGIGVNYYLSSSLGIFAEARYSKELVKGIGMTFVPLTAGVLFGI